MIGERELRVLSDLDSPKYLRELAADLDYREDTVSETLGILEKVGLVRKKRTAQGTIAEPSDARCIEIFQSLTGANPHIDFPDLLTKSMLNVLYYLSSENPWTATELAERTGHARATIYRNLRTLTNRAMVLKDRSQYRLSEKFEDLHRFAYELRHHLHRVKIKRHVGNGALVWESHKEFLLRTESEVDHSAYHRTGLDAFAEYELQFFTTSEHYYFYSEERNSLTPADLVCHLLLIENDSRHRKYALLLIVEAGLSQERVEEAANYYGIEDIVLPLLRFLSTEGEGNSDETPRWKEFKELASEYEVEL